MPIAQSASLIASRKPINDLYAECFHFEAGYL